MAVERERTFLLSAPPPAGDTRPLRQAYVAIDGDVQVRVRDDGDHHVVTIKGGSGRTRTEVEVAVDTAERDQLWELAGDRVVEKLRTRIDLGGGLTAESDEFIGRHAGLRLVEVEFATEDEAEGFEPPVWFGDEVTDEPWAANVWLAVNGLPNIDHRTPGAPPWPSR